VNLDPQALEEQRFVEEIGLFVERGGMPRMAGRIMGRLLIAAPPHQSAGELADSLLASRGSVSTATRLLIQLGLIERVGLHGHRRDYFRIRPNAWFQMTMQDNVRLVGLRELTGRGLRLLDDADQGLRGRLDELMDLCEFYDRELPGLLERWERWRQTRKERVE
jgi:hypothetical protein